MTDDATTSMTVRWLHPGQISARWEPDSARLIVKIDGGDDIVDAQVRLALPMSRPGQFVNISDAKNESLGMLAKMTGLDQATRNAIDAALQMRYMIPWIVRIMSVTEHSSFVLRWHVETNLGERIFFTESTRESARYHGLNRIRVTDLAGNQYDIPDLSNLDTASRDILATYL